MVRADGAQAGSTKSHALADPSPPGDHEQRRTLGVSVAATFLVLAAYTVPLSTLRPTAAALHTGPEGQAWLLSAMSVGLSATLLASGAIADSYGRRRVFVAGAAVLAAGSALAALAQGTLEFVLARGVEGVGGAALTSCSLGLLGHAFPGADERTRATGLWGASLGAGIAAGPLLASWLDARAGWRASYWLIAACAALLAVAAAGRLTESRSPLPRRPDYLGTALLMAGLSGLLAGLIEVRGGWARPAPIGLLVGGGLLLVAFVGSQARRGGTMLDLGLFRRADFVGATAGALANGLGVISLMIFVPTLIERGLGRSAVAASLALLAWSGVSVLSALAARRLSSRLTARHQMTLGLLGVAAGQASLGGLHPGSPLGRLVPGLVLAGVASGLLNAALARQAVASVPPGSASVGSGANNTARYVGAALGMTVVVMLAGRPDRGALLAGWDLAVLVTTSFSLLGALAVSLCRWGPPASAPR
jgi:MFS family permease